MISGQKLGTAPAALKTNVLPRPVVREVNGPDGRLVVEVVRVAA